MMKRLQLIFDFRLLPFLLFPFYLSLAQTSKQELSDCPEKTGGVNYAYPSKDIVPQTPVPKGYEAFYISHFGRHGSRYLVSDNDYKQVLDKMLDANEHHALTPLGLDVLARLKKIWNEAEGHGGDLSPLGVRQQRAIAERMFTWYPKVFSDNAIVSARSTTVVRCVLSMDAFSERLKEWNPKLQITREASNKYMNYLNFHTKEAIDFRSSADTWREEFRKFEENHVKPMRLITSLFTDSVYVIKKINPKLFMQNLYEIASNVQNMETSISFYDLFEKQELFDLWQCRNYPFYVEYANSSQNGGIMLANAKPVLKNILESANEFIESKHHGATLRFAHDGNIVPLAALLHLQGCYSSESNPDEFYKVWSDFKVAPMAGNIQLVFFQKKNTAEILVKFLLNEKEILVPPITSNVLPYYQWNDVKSYYAALLKD